MLLLGSCLCVSESSKVHDGDMECLVGAHVPCQRGQLTPPGMYAQKYRQAGLGEQHQEGECQARSRDHHSEAQLWQHGIKIFGRYPHSCLPSTICRISSCKESSPKDFKSHFTWREGRCKTAYFAKRTQWRKTSWSPGVLYYIQVGFRPPLIQYSTGIAQKSLNLWTRTILVFLS